MDSWTPTHYAFTTTNAFIFFLKMHSYSATNFQLRSEWLENPKQKKTDQVEYPHNVGLH
jgi:diacylglycerol O-acyltransferase-1